jgi:NAD(P)-dependent dehydrogenase (short-subunit alcohol dehydrogenase family)
MSLEKSSTLPVVVITGGGGLLGREHALALTKDNYSVVLIDKDYSKLQIALKEIRNESPGSEISLFECDLTSEVEIESVVKEIEAKFGKIDVLINNASINPTPGEMNVDNSFENFSLLNWQDELAVGLTGTLLMCKYVCRVMMQHNSGVIINIASDLSVIAPDQRIYLNDETMSRYVKPISYSVIKHGVIGLTKYLATYCAPYGIRVNALSPGGVETDQPEGFKTKLKNLIPMNRMARKDEYHEAIRFLSGPGSKYMTGHNLIIDGGRTIW